MKYISAEEFLKADRKVVDEIIEWWKPSIGDLTESTVEGEVWCLIDDIQVERVLKLSKEHLIIPLLTVGQLIDFIEDKTRYYLNISYDEYDDYGYILDIGINKYYTKYCVLIKALWEVVQEVCNEE